LRRPESTPFNRRVTWIDQRGSEVLDRNECQRLLSVAAGGVGRIGLVNAGQVMIKPVNYRMFDADVGRRSEPPPPRRRPTPRP